MVTDRFFFIMKLFCIFWFSRRIFSANTFSNKKLFIKVNVFLVCLLNKHSSTAFCSNSKNKIVLRTKTRRKKSMKKMNYCFPIEIGFPSLFFVYHLECFSYLFLRFYLEFLHIFRSTLELDENMENCIAVFIFANVHFKNRITWEFCKLCQMTQLNYTSSSVHHYK